METFLKGFILSIILTSVIIMITTLLITFLTFLHS